MKKINHILLYTLLILSSKGIWAQETSPSEMNEGGIYSLQQCVDFALQNHEQIKNAKLENDISNAKVKETLGIGLPQVSGKFDVTVSPKIQKQFVPGDALLPGGDPNQLVALGFGVPYSNNLNLTISQLIFNGSYLVGLQAAKVYKELSKKQLSKTEIDVIEGVTKAYYSTLVASERLKLLEINKDQLDALLSDMKVMYENGLTEKLDLQRLSVNINNLKTEIRKIENLVVVSQQLLKFQMGVDMNIEITLSENLESYISNLTSVSEKTAEYSNRIEYSQLQTQQLLQQLDLKNKKVQRYPSLGAFASMGYTTGGLDFAQSFEFSDWEPYMMVGVSLNVPIFSGFQSTHQIQQSAIKLKQIDNNFLLLKRNIDFETSKTQKDYQNVLSTLDTQKENIDLAKEVFDVTKIKYKEGYASNLEVVQAESDLKEAQSNYFGAIYDALVAKVALDKALGNLHK